MASIFIQSTLILLREGLEALLVIAALAAYLDKAGARDRVVALYVGGGTAIAASLLAAWLFEILNNGAHSDLMEAAVIVVAAALMLYVSGWLMLRQDPRTWQSFLKSKADEALARRTGIAVAVLAFLAVFREGAESVLFIHALATTSGGWSVELIGGLMTAAVSLAILFFVINNVARRLPLRPVFIATSAFLFFMAIKFIGQAIQELQEQQLVSYTNLRGAGWLDRIGFNPTVEAIAAQMVVMVIMLAVFTFVMWDRRGRVSALEAFYATLSDEQKAQLNSDRGRHGRSWR
jgi:high-affinity iron transporter